MCNSRKVKFIVTFAIIFVLMVSSLSGVYALKADYALPVFDFINGTGGDIQAIKYYNTDLSIKGKALEDTNISISTFWYKPYNEKTIIYKNRLKHQDDGLGEWILQQSECCQVGISCIFGMPVTVKPGRNKIVVKSDHGLFYEMEVEYVSNEEIVEKINSIFFKNLDLGF